MYAWKEEFLLPIKSIAHLDAEEAHQALQVRHVRHVRDVEAVLGRHVLALLLQRAQLGRAEQAVREWYALVGGARGVFVDVLPIQLLLALLPPLQMKRDIENRDG